MTNNTLPSFALINIIFLLYPGPSITPSLLNTYPINSTYYFTCQFSSASGVVDTFPLILNVTDKKFFADVEQRQIAYYMDGGSAGYTGVFLEEKKIWLHPPREKFLSFLQFCPFPQIRIREQTDTVSWQDTLHYIGQLDITLKNPFARKRLYHQYEFKEKKWEETDISSSYHNIGKRDTVISGKAYKDVYVVKAQSLLTNKKSPKVDGARGTSLILFSPQKGFEYMHYTFADTLQATFVLDSMVVPQVYPKFKRVRGYKFD